MTEAHKLQYIDNKLELMRVNLMMAIETTAMMQNTEVAEFRLLSKQLAICEEIIQNKINRAIDEQES